MYPSIGLARDSQNSVQRGGTAGKEEKRNGEQNTGKEFFEFFSQSAHLLTRYIVAYWQNGSKAEFMGEKVTKLDKGFRRGYTYTIAGIGKGSGKWWY